MNDQPRRLGRRALATMAATVPFGASALGPKDATGQASAAPVLFATPTPPAPGGMSMVYVSGHGSVRVPPDIASIVIGIDVERPTVAEAQAEATTLTAAIMEVVEGAGVASDDIRTARFTVRLVRERGRDEEEPRRRETIGFQVANAVEVTVRDLDRLGQILDEAIAAGANDVGQIAFTVADPAAAAGQARARAVADARGKADELAAAAGMAISRVITILETFSPPPVPFEFEDAQVRATAIADASGGDVPIAIGADEVSVELQVAYELSER